VANATGSKILEDQNDASSIATAETAKVKKREFQSRE
jgi:hypothetical protein